MHRVVLSTSETNGTSFVSDGGVTTARNVPINIMGITYTNLVKSISADLETNKFIVSRGIGDFMTITLDDSFPTPTALQDIINKALRTNFSTITNPLQLEVSAHAIVSDTRGGFVWNNQDTVPWQIKIPSVESAEVWGFSGTITIQPGISTQTYIVNPGLGAKFMYFKSPQLAGEIYLPISGTYGDSIFYTPTNKIKTLVTSGTSIMGSLLVSFDAIKRFAMPLKSIRDDSLSFMYFVSGKDS